MITPQTATAPGLLDPLAVGALQLPNRVIMTGALLRIAVAVGLLRTVNLKN